MNEIDTNIPVLQVVLVIEDLAIEDDKEKAKVLVTEMASVVSTLEANGHLTNSPHLQQGSVFCAASEIMCLKTKS